MIDLCTAGLEQSCQRLSHLPSWSADDLGGGGRGHSPWKHQVGALKAAEPPARAIWRFTRHDWLFFFSQQAPERTR